MSQTLLERFDADTCRRLRQALSRWYRQHGRDLPWRQTRDPYRIWISEIMLQQTTVKAVVPYYDRFITRFPSVHDLAAATESEVLQHWEGLGYYSRGRNLHRAAQVLCRDREGEFPRALDELHALPGIGRYTAGAIRSFAFDLPAPIVEANTLRLYCRLLGFDGDPRDASGQQLLWDFAERLQPARAAGPVNQGLMELGATLCTPVAPACPECPLKKWCAAFAAGTQSEIPRKPERARVTRLVEGTVALQHRGRWLVKQREPGERWAGLWDFPRFPLEGIDYDAGPANGAAEAAASRSLREIASLPVNGLQHVTDLHHSVTRYRIRLICWKAQVTGPLSPNSHSRANSAPLRWVTASDLADLPMPVTGRKLANLLHAR